MMVDHSEPTHLLAPATDDFRKRLRWYRSKLLTRLGYRADHWCRVVYIDAWKKFLQALPLAELDALEISPGPTTHWRDIGFGHYEGHGFPSFDICKETLPRQFDVILAENIFEHLRDPYAAARNVLTMLRPRGYFLILTPFMIRLHPTPGDYSRWTPQGLGAFLSDTGFEPGPVEAWGNRACVKANLTRWPNYGWYKDLSNDPELPVGVWAYARPRLPR